MTSISPRRLALSASAIVATLAMSIAPAATFAAGPVFDNPSFENGTYERLVPSFDFARPGDGSTAITGWTISEGVDWVGTYWKAADGDRSIDLDGSEVAEPGAISQTFPTSASGTYVVTFAMSGNPDSGPADKNMTVTAAAASQSYLYNTSVEHTTRTDMNWLPKTFTFVATGVSTTLTFASTTPGGYGPVIDNVVITQTLKTGADCKNGGWRTMVDKYGTAFRNQGDCVSYYATGEKNLAF